MEQIRTFIAIELPEALREEITRLQDKLKDKSRVSVRWVNAGNIHLTLKFLGDIGNDKVDDILEVLSESTRGIASFRLGVKGLGVFPNPQRPRIIWVGVSGALDKLGILQKQIDKALAHLGFPSERRPFSPHLTIARLHDRATSADRNEMGRLIEETSFTSRQDFLAGEVHCIKSLLTREGPVYTRLGTVQLG